MNGRADASWVTVPAVMQGRLSLPVVGALPAVGDSVDFGLYKDGDTPTDAGKAYRAAG